MLCCFFFAARVVARSNLSVTTPGVRSPTSVRLTARARTFKEPPMLDRFALKTFFKPLFAGLVDIGIKAPFNKLLFVVATTTTGLHLFHVGISAEIYVCSRKTSASIPSNCSVVNGLARKLTPPMSFNCPILAWSINPLIAINFVAGSIL